MQDGLLVWKLPVGLEDVEVISFGGAALASSYRLIVCHWPWTLSLKFSTFTSYSWWFQYLLFGSWSESELSQNNLAIWFLVDTQTRFENTKNNCLNRIFVFFWGRNFNFFVRYLILVIIKIHCDCPFGLVTETHLPAFCYIINNKKLIAILVKVNIS